MSKLRDWIITCHECKAKTWYSTDWRTGKLVEKAGPCTCVKQKSVAVEGDLPMTGKCVDCGGPCRSISKRCTPCGHEWSSHDYLRRRVQFCVCGKELVGSRARVCPECRERNNAAAKRAYQDRGRRPRESAA